MTALAGQRVAIEWSILPNEQGGRMLWLGSWMVGDEGEEGAWFYNGRGGEQSDVTTPAEATGIRIYRWVNEGLDPEYVDLELRGAEAIRTGDLDFDRPKRFSRLVLDKD